jgi:alkaline phosphatase D
MMDARSDLCGAVDLTGVRGEITYDVFVEDARGARSDPMRGRLHVRGAGDPLRLAWSGDVCGQGWGIDPARGGLAIFTTLRKHAPDVFIHSGDSVYADVPLEPRLVLPDATLWHNVTTQSKSRPASTIDDYWGNHAYNLLDEAYREFLAEVPLVAQWDDHETTNNWAPGDRLTDAMAAHARRAFLDYLPVRRDGDRIHRVVRPHPEVHLFVLDARTWRTPNTDNGGADVALGDAQVRWLIDELRASRATWKIVCNDAPLSLIIPDGDPYELDGGWIQRQEGFAQGDGPPRGRELELAGILASTRDLRGVVWLTADVHYAAAHRYDPERAMFREFSPFWEFIAGPLHAAAFGPNPLDPTFGPEVVFSRTPPEHLYGSGPAGGLASFGALAFDPKTRALAVALHDKDGAVMWSEELAP